jgi:hypothetical protein
MCTSGENELRSLKKLAIFAHKLIFRKKAESGDFRENLVLRNLLKIDEMLQAISFQP